MGAETIISGRIWDGQRFDDGYMVICDEKVKETVFGETSKEADITGTVLPGLVDTHTHVADAGLRLDRKYSLEELVAPPDGLKHRYLKDANPFDIHREMSDYIMRLELSGVSRFIDFREGGTEGVKLLRSVSRRATILGRPISKEYDPNEIDSILYRADGIGIPSITDMDRAYIDAVADHVKRKNKMLALHVSERIREDIDYVMSLQPDLIVHMVQATDSDLRRCADENVPISICPSSNLYFGMVPPVARMLDAGVDVCLGTDNAMLFPSADIFTEARVLSGLLETQGRDPMAAYGILIACGHKVLYHDPITPHETGSTADITVFPCTEEELLKGDTKASARYGP